MSCGCEFCIDCDDVLSALSRCTKLQADLIVTSPPYNVGKEYEVDVEFESYLEWQRKVIAAMSNIVRSNGSICYQVGNYVENGHIEPLDVYVHTMFTELGWRLRNRIVWRFGHGLHCKKRFSGRYEVVLWYTRSEDYYFDLDAVRIPPKYPGKKAYKGSRKGTLSCNPLGKNPEDVWDIPNVVGNHVEKAAHPCQFPVGLAERLVLALSPPGGLVCDPFCGVGSSGVAALSNGRRFYGVDSCGEYCEIAKERCYRALEGEERYRPHGQPVFDHKLSKLSVAESGDGGGIVKVMERVGL